MSSFRLLLLSCVAKAAFAIFLAVPHANAKITPMDDALSEAKVFEWWDDGLIDGNEASEMLDLLEQGNLEEACLMAEVLVQESCPAKEKSESRPAKQKKGKSNGNEDKLLKTLHGHVLLKTRTDSLGHVKNFYKALSLQFYHFTLKLGNQNILSYNHQGAAAHLGQISARELGNLIPMDTLWGTTASYDIHGFQVAGFLDTALNWYGKLGYAFGSVAKQRTDIDFTYWHTAENSSVELQTSFPFGEVAAWWQMGQRLPLVKIQLQGNETLDDSESSFGKTRKAKAANFFWKTTAYIHGDSVPTLSNISRSILKNRFWGAQTIGFNLKDDWNSKLTANVGATAPIALGRDVTGENDAAGSGNANTQGSNTLGNAATAKGSSGAKAMGADSASLRFKLTAESGPQAVRGTLSATCLEASDACLLSDWKLQLASNWKLPQPLGESIQFLASAKTRFSRENLFQKTQLDAGSVYRISGSNWISLGLKLPDSNPQKQIQIKNALSLALENLKCTMSITFRRTQDQDFHPIHADMQIKFFL